MAEDLEGEHKRKRGFFTNIKRILLVIVILILGCLLILAGVGLIEFSLELLLYSGIILVVFGLIYYFLY